MKVIYVLSHAYSGSTLLGLFLGSMKGITNLGEVIYLGKDLHPYKKCCCGDSLKNCTFWGDISIDSIKLLARRELNLIDRRGGIEKLLYRFTGTLPYNRKQIREYTNINKQLFQSLQKNATEIFVDLSKSVERLEILSKSDFVELKLVYLKRDLKDVLRSTLKRPKLTRKKYGMKRLREYIWLRINDFRQRQLILSLKSIDVYEMNFIDFLHDPNKEVSEMLSKFNLKEHFEKKPRKINLKEQHVYTGNKWLTKSKDTYIEIVKPK